MSQFPTNKTVPLDKDIGVHETLPAPASTGAREQLSEVLKSLNTAIATETANRIADVNAEETRALGVESDLQQQINDEISDRIADVNAEELRATTAEAAEALARTNADADIQLQIERERSLLRMTVTGANKVVSVAASSNVRKNDNTNLSLPNGSLISDYSGGSINFATGTVTGGGDNFTPINFAGQAGKWAKYALVLLPTLPNSILVLPGDSFGATAASAVAPAFDGGIPIGIIAVKDDGSAGIGTINNIVQTDLIQFLSSGSGSGGSGSGSPLDVEDSTFLYYTRSDFSVDKKKFFGSTTGVEQILGLKKIVLNTGNTFTSLDLIGAQVKKDAPSLQAAQAKLMYATGKVDEAAQIEFSRDAGTSWQTGIVSLPGSDTSADYEGAIVIADMNWASSTAALFNAGTPNGTLSSGQRVAAIINPTYRMVITSFELYLRTLATSGSAVGRIMSVNAGAPNTVLRSSKETLAAGQDITTVPGFKRFSLAPMTLEPGTQYALVVEGIGLSANLSADQVTAGPAWDVSSSTHNGSGWSAAAAKLAIQLYGTGLDLRLRVTSGTAGSELMGFGVDFVQDTAALVNGDASYEERFITSSEATTGLVTLGSVRYTPSARQLQVYHSGHVYMSPDFTEVGPNQVQFPTGWFQPGDLVKFRTAFGLVDGSSLAISKIAALYDAIVGSAAQVAVGVATHSTIAGALVGLPSNGRILLLRGSYTENVSVSSNCMIEGEGYGSVINGTFALTPGSDYSTVKALKFGGNVTLTSNGNFIRECFLASTALLTDSGVANSKLVIQE